MIRARLLPPSGGTLRAKAPPVQRGGWFVPAPVTITVRIISDSPGGGILTVNAPNGSPGDILSTTDHGGAVPVNDPKGRPDASLPDAGFGKKREEEGCNRQCSGRH